MSQNKCASCFGPKAKFVCKACEEPVCKECAQFVDESRVAFLALNQRARFIGVYCRACFVRDLEPELAAYDEIVARAEEVVVFSAEQGKESRLIKRNEKPLEVKEAVDRNEVIAHLSFLAAKDGFNCLVDVEAVSKKTHDGSYTLVKWSGRGIPAKLDRRR